MNKMNLSPSTDPGAGRRRGVARLTRTAGVIAAIAAIGQPAAPALAGQAGFSGKPAQMSLASSLPEVSNVVPDAGPPSGGTLVGIGGTHFTGATEVHFGTTPATSFKVKSDGKIEAIAPAEGEGRVDVTVTTPEGTSAVNQGDHFTFVPPGPYVTEVRPSEGSVEGGHPVHLLGTDFAGATSVTFGGVPASFEVLNPEAIVATSPVGRAPLVDVQVTTPEGTSPANPDDEYTYLPKYIEISELSESRGPAAGGSGITISGEGFFGVTGVEFGGVEAESFTVNSPESIAVVSPPHTVGEITVTVQTTFGPSLPEYCQRNKGIRRRNCPTRDYYHYKEPRVESVSPGSGPIAGGTPVTITGFGFAEGESGTEILFNKAPATSVDCTSATTCTAVAPPAAKRGTVYLKATVRTNETEHSKKNPVAKFVYE